MTRVSPEPSPRVAPERYELRYAVGRRFSRDLRNTLGIPKTSHIIGASFQVGGIDGRGDTVVLLIERSEERRT